MECFACVCVQYAVEAPERVKKKKKPSGWFSSWFSSSDDEEDIEVETESKGRGIFLFFFMGYALCVCDARRSCQIYTILFDYLMHRHQRERGGRETSTCGQQKRDMM